MNKNIHGTVEQFVGQIMHSVMLQVRLGKDVVGMPNGANMGGISLADLKVVKDWLALPKEKQNDGGFVIAIGAFLHLYSVASHVIHELGGHKGVKQFESALHDSIQNKDAT